MAKKIPLRKCIACNEQKEKKSLIRIVNNRERGLVIDPTGKMNGRGAYLCRNKECIDKAKDSKALNKALKTNIDDAIYKEILNYVD